MKIKRSSLFASAIERGRKLILKLLKAEGGVVELDNRNALRLMMERNGVFIVKIGNEQVVPVWQFNDRIYPHMFKILKIFKRKKSSNLTAMIFFISRNLRLADKSPLQALQEGRVKDVMRAANAYHIHGAA